MSDEPSKRSLNHMAPDVKLVHIRLEVWGRWAKDRAPGDWPERTILARLMEEGPGAGQITSKVVEIPEGIAETDWAVAHLKNPERLVIKTFYTQWSPVEVMCRKTRLRPRQFKAVLQRARWQLVGWFSHP